MFWYLVPFCVLILLFFYGRWRTRRIVKEKVRSLLGAAERQTSSGGDGLPDPLERYLRWALPGKQDIRVVRLAQEGRIRTDPRKGRWMAFRARQVVVPRAPGFVWDARVQAYPGMHVRVLDSYVAGRGGGRVSLLSAFTLAEESGCPELDAASLHRFLAEGPWCPSVLRPGPDLTWTGIDEHRALATFRDRETEVSLEFRFAESGEVEGIHTPGRWCRTDKGFVERAWEGHFGNHEEVQGLRIPMSGVVGWYQDDRWEPVWEGRITRYEALFHPGRGDRPGDGQPRCRA